MSHVARLDDSSSEEQSRKRTTKMRDSRDSDGKRSLYFVSRDCNWQKYRNDIMRRLGGDYGVSVKVLTTGDVAEYIQNDESVEYLVHRSWLPKKWNLSFYPGALLRIYRDRPDAVLGMANVSQLTEPFALVLCWLLGIRFVWWTHGYDHVEYYRSRLLRFCKKVWTLFLLRRADAVITFSNEARRYLVRQGLREDKVICAPNTLDTDALSAMARRVRSEMPRQLLARPTGLDEDAQVVLVSCRLNARKRVEDAIRAVAEVKDSIPRVHLAIVGDGPERARLQELAGRLLPDRVTFYGSVYDDARLARIFCMADLLIMPSHVGLVIVHGFCFGLPLLTEHSDDHGPEIQYLRDGYNGYFVGKRDIKGLADRLRDVLSDDEKRRFLSRNALETVQGEANVNLMLARMALALNLESGAGIPEAGTHR